VGRLRQTIPTVLDAAQGAMTMKLGQYEVAMHEAGHLVVHAKVGSGHAAIVKIGADSGWMQHHDWSLTKDYDLDLRAVLSSGGLAVERIRGRDPFDRGGSDWTHMRTYSRKLLDADQMMSVVHAAEEFLRRRWSIVEFAAKFLLANMNRQGFVGKKACRRLYAEIRKQLEDHAVMRRRAKRARTLCMIILDGPD